MGADKRFEVVVIGSGMAGLTAGLFAARLGHSTLVLVQLMAGGQVATINRIEDFPGHPEGVAGFDLGPSIQEQAAAAGAYFEMGEAVGLARTEAGWRVATDQGAIDAAAIILATGSRNRSLGVPGEERFEARGISHCASCDGPLLKGETVVVVGAGDSGIQEALALAEFAARVIVLECASAPVAQAAYLQRLPDQPKIEVRCDVEVAEVIGEDAVSGVRVRHRSQGTTEILQAKAVFVYAGLAPNSALVAGLLELDSRGRIPTDTSMRTALPGLFAAGDVRADSAGQAITAAGDGATAAIAAHRYIYERAHKEKIAVTR